MKNKQLRFFLACKLVLALALFQPLVFADKLSLLSEKIHAEARRVGVDEEFLLLHTEDGVQVFREHFPEAISALIRDKKFLLELAPSGSAWPGEGSHKEDPKSETTEISTPAARIAQGVQAIQERDPYREQIFEMYLFEKDKLQFSAKAEHARVLVPEGASGTGKKQAFREIFRFTQPRFLEQEKRLRFRFEDRTQDDLVWQSSPVHGQVRELGSFGSGEDISRFPISLDDLDGYSGALLASAIFRHKEEVFLVPQLRKPELQQSTEQDCVQLQWNHRQSLWNGQSNRYPNRPQWIPANLVFVPRKVYSISIKPRALIFGRGVLDLVIDKESSLPVMSVLYTPMGDPQRISLHAYAFAGNTRDAHTAAAQSFFYDITADRAALLVSPQVTWCGAARGKERLGEFSPFVR